MSGRAGFAAREWLDGHVNLELGVGAPRSRPRVAPTLERIGTLLTYLGTPQDEWPMVHVTGTNGKTSVARMTAEILQVSGLRVGTFTSPHLERLEERIAVDGDPIAPDDLDEMLYAVSLVEQATGVDPSHFEIMVAAAYRWFADAAVDVAVVEVGLGGRWDATSAVEGRVAVVTNVGLDHTEWLGPTRAHIAAEKAGIVVGGAPLVLGETDPALLPPFVDRAPDPLRLRGRDFGVRANRSAVGGRLVDLFTPAAAYPELFVALLGAHQGENAAIAMTAAEATLGEPVPEAVAATALAGVRSPGRLEIVGRDPLVLLDGAHNPDGITVLAAALAEELGADVPTTYVLGFSRERDPGEMLDRLGVRPETDLLVCTRAPHARALAPALIAAAAVDRGFAADRIEIADGVADAIGTALLATPTAGRIVVTGSLYLVGAARSVFVRS
ncbi:MAG: bifunctional folylpolyglutamate synthase/dihydrofolate synthase [Actinomycetota bacterium]